MLPLLLALLACTSTDDSAVVAPQIVEPDPVPESYPVALSFLNEDDPDVLIVSLSYTVQCPDETEPREQFRNWQRPQPGEDLVLAGQDSISQGCVFDATFAVCKFWNLADPIASWRAWAVTTDTIGESVDAQLVFFWPGDRFRFHEIDWPPSVLGNPEGADHVLPLPFRR
jgi:hypothetical protein